MQTALEHYEALQDPVYRVYQERLKAVLKQGNLTILLNQSAPTSPRTPTDQTFTFAHASSGSVSARCYTESDSEEAESLLETSQSESSLTVRKIQTDLSLQNRSVSSRLDKRKKEAISPRNRDQNSTYSLELERLLEGFIQRKVRLEGQITTQYREQRQELEAASKSVIVSRVIAEMHKSEENDLRSLNEAIEAEKYKAIQLLRAQHLASPH
jgi:hypothetical protein